MGLRRLMLRDFVIVCELEQEVGAGFTVLTGETGAGKSILIDALQLLLGGRCDASVVREGASRCEVSAEFDCPEGWQAWLDEQGLAGGDEGVLLRRVVDAQGRSRSWINGSAATVAQLKTLGAALVDIHGQHAWQSLTRAETVRALLDAYGRIDTQPLRLAHGAWHSAHQRWQDALAQQQSLQEQHERLLWQVNEVSKLAPGAQEWDELNQQHRQLSHAQTLIEAAMGAVQRLRDAPASAAELVAQTLDEIEPLKDIDARFAEPAQALRSALALVQDAAHTLKHLGHHTDQDPQALQGLDERLALWISLSRRYRCAAAELPELWQRWQTELARLASVQDVDELERQATALHQKLSEHAQAVSRQRQRAAAALGQAVTESMQKLGMAGGVFEVVLQDLPAIGAQGGESVEFLVAGHPGATPKPVAKVASGGELSRIALAISVVTSELGEAGTLIFDEVDAGIGGQVAHTVGELLRQLGQHRQVLAVTHLAQVAACGHHHWLLSKHLQQGHTQSRLQVLQPEARVGELARMLGGKVDSAVSMAHARELLQP